MNIAEIWEDELYIDPGFGIPGREAFAKIGDQHMDLDFHMDFQTAQAGVVPL
jgi:hypothetical protein